MTFSFRLFELEKLVETMVTWKPEQAQVVNFREYYKQSLRIRSFLVALQAYYSMVESILGNWENESFGFKTTNSPDSWCNSVCVT